MLPWLALTYTAARLGFEAQNAAAFRLLRLGRGITKTAANEIVPEAIMPPADTTPAPIAVAPKRRHTAKKIQKKSAAVRKHGKRANELVAPLPASPTPSRHPNSSESSPWHHPA